MGEMETRSLPSHVQDANPPKQECKAVLQHEEWQELHLAGRKCALMWEDPCPPHQGGCDQYHLIYDVLTLLIVPYGLVQCVDGGVMKKNLWLNIWNQIWVVKRLCRRPKAQLTSGLAPLGHDSTLPSTVLHADWAMTEDVPSYLCLGPCLHIKMYFSICPNSCLYLSIYVGKGETQTRPIAHTVQ